MRHAERKRGGGGKNLKRKKVNEFDSSDEEDDNDEYVDQDHDSDDSDCEDSLDLGRISGELLLERRTLQLLGCGCMMIASKMHETSPPDAKDFCYISAQTYTRKKIIEMELDICTLLAFNFHIVTPQHFANVYLRANHVSGNGSTVRPVCTMVYEDAFSYLVQYLLELSSLYEEFMHEPPSKVAAAAVYLARATMGIRDESESEVILKKQGFFSRTLQYYSGHDIMDLKKMVMQLHERHVAIVDEELNSVYSKFSKKTFKKVALRMPVDEGLLTASFNEFEVV